MMKRAQCAFRALLLAASAVAAASQNSSGGNGWRTADRFSLTSARTGSAGDIGADRSGTVLFSVGSSRMNDGTNAAVIRMSKDAGATWRTVDQFVQPAASQTHYRGFGASPSGSLFACGEAFGGGTNSSGKNWIVRQSIDGGESWFTSDELTDWARYPQAGDIKAAPSGEVYAAGTIGGSCCFDWSLSAFQWAVRRSLDDGKTWQSIDLVGSLMPFNFSQARSIAFRNGAVFVAGELSLVQDWFGASVWTVRRSMDKGATWTTIDAFQAEPGHSAGAEGIAITPNGDLVACGWANGGSGNSPIVYWVVRRSRDGGESWETVDTIVTLNSGAAIPNQIASDPSGNVWVSGYASINGTARGWIVRKGTPGADGTLEWTTSDFVGGVDTRPNAIMANLDGKVFAAGRLDAGAGIASFTTRMLESAGATGDFGVDPFRLDNPSPLRGPPIKILLVGQNLLISWPHSLRGAVLEWSDTLPATIWSTVQILPIEIGDEDVVLIDTSSRVRFFRLRER